MKIVPSDGIAEVEYRVQIGHSEVCGRKDKVECMPDCGGHVFAHPADYLT
jgi:hypothetical protein